VLIEFISEYGLFLAKVATFIIGFLILVAVLAQVKSHDSSGNGKLEIKSVNDHFDDMRDKIRESIFDKHQLKLFLKELKQSEKKENKLAKENAKNEGSLKKLNKKNIYVLDFDGDMKASGVECLREEITAILSMATADDEVIIRLESPGGMVHSYGLASSQLARIRNAKIPLTICVDRVAASGGYMMACIANKILAAPFAVLGSIGVVASLPNFNKVLKKYDVDYELITAGEYKRTLTMLGENTESGRKKFIQDLEETHVLFKDFVSDYRPNLDINSVATGETWYGKKALEKNLIDEVSTSDEYIFKCSDNASVFHVQYTQKKSWQEKIGISIQAAIEKSIDKMLLKVLNDWSTRH
jgi:serine protease SohB